MKHFALAATTSVAALLVGATVWGGVGPASGGEADAVGSASVVTTRGTQHELVIWSAVKNGGKTIDIRKDGFSPGDYTVGQGVYKTKTGEKLGVWASQCILLSSNPGRAECRTSAKVYGMGRLETIQGQFSGPVDRGVIVGGTNQFLGAEGSYTLIFKPHRLGVVFEYVL